MHILTSSKKNKMAFSGNLYCPHPKKGNWSEKCNAQKWKFDRYITPLRIRYICKECGKGVQYDIS